MNKINKPKTIEDKLILTGFIIAILFMVFAIFSQIYTQLFITNTLDTRAQASFEVEEAQTKDINEDTEISPINYELIDDFNVTYSLLNGWNFIAFPIRPINFDTASGLLQDIINKGGYATVVARWDGDKWQEYVRRGEEQFGQDFHLQPAEAYFVRAHTTMSWKLSGAPVEDDYLSNIQIEPGWNAIGIPLKGKTASNVLNSLNQGQEKTTEINHWDSGSWQVYVKRLYETKTQEYGTDFEILKNKGYMIYANQNTLLEINE